MRSAGMPITAADEEAERAGDGQCREERPAVVGNRGSSSCTAPIPKKAEWPMEIWPE